MRKTRLTIPDLLGIAVWLIAEEIHKAKDQIVMALADTIAQLTTEDAEIKADVEALLALNKTEADQITSLQQQIADLAAAGQGATPEQVAALQTVADDLAATHSEAQAALPAPAAS